jgi:hypothetical protein
MATTVKCGSTGSTSLGGEVTEFNINIHQDTPETTSMASAGFKEYISCLKSMTGDFKTNIPCGVIGSHLGVTFVNDKETITSNIIITSINDAVKVDGVIQYSYNLESTGAVVIS